MTVFSCFWVKFCKIKWSSGVTRKLFLSLSHLNCKNSLISCCKLSFIFFLLLNFVRAVKKHDRRSSSVGSYSMSLIFCTMSKNSLMIIENSATPKRIRNEPIRRSSSERG